MIEYVPLIPHLSGSGQRGIMPRVQNSHTAAGSANIPALLGTHSAPQDGTLA